MPTILLTGGAGYIASHTAVELISAGHKVVVIDNLSNSSFEAVKRVGQITDSNIPFTEADVRDQQALDQVFTDHDIAGVMHFAGLKSVGESVARPIDYYRNNLDSTLALVSAMQRYDVKRLIFSSSATVYGTPNELPLTEDSRVGVDISNPYGHTKFMCEQILRDVAAADPEFEVTLLRYFNPIGAHESGLIGEDPSDIPNNLMPYIAQTAVGLREQVNVFGNNYDTPDGTGVRDYIHVVDLARGHIAALEHSQAGTATYNLGTGHGTSVLELIAAFSKASSKDIPFKIVDRRPGDIASCYASATKAATKLNWTASKSIMEACEDSWRWQLANPNGYREP